MMTIKQIQISKPFRYLWLKSVKGVDLSNHCAKSLIGDYDSRVNARVHVLHDVDLTEDIYYLCGVAVPYVWENNFHLAFRSKPGVSFIYESNGIMVEMQDAEQIRFSECDIDPTLPEAKRKVFNTCRNWQFANWYHNNIQ